MAHYPLFDRNAEAGFCSPATANFTNVVRVGWHGEHAARSSARRVVTMGRCMRRTLCSFHVNGIRSSDRRGLSRGFKRTQTDFSCVREPIEFASSIQRHVRLVEARTAELGDDRARIWKARTSNPLVS